MMRLWREDYTRPVSRGPSAAMSIAVHSALIAGAVIATNPPEGLVTSLYELANRVIYVAPPPRSTGAPGSDARLQYTEIAPIGPGSGFARAPVPSGDRKPDQVLFTLTPGDLGTEKEASVESAVSRGIDSVFTLVDVDSAVSTDPTSSAPAYPEGLIKLGIEGFVKARYVVDSTGLADSATLEVVEASRVEFELAVRQALPKMHFIPARIGPRKVRQLVEQQFNFRILRPADTLPPPKKPPA
jgi:hypothetical protein